MPMRPDEILADGPDFEDAARRTLTQAAQMIGGRATTKYMRAGGTNVPMGNDRTGPGSLRKQTGRLARSLIGARASQLGGSEGVFDLSPTSNGVRLRYGSRVEYAAMHEYGGRQRVTPRQRGYFWHRHAETGNDQWKWMALSETLAFPERPYLRPALEDSKDEIREIAEEEVLKVLFDE